VRRGRTHEAAHEATEPHRATSGDAPAYHHPFTQRAAQSHVRRRARPHHPFIESKRRTRLQSHGAATSGHGHEATGTSRTEPRETMPGEKHETAKPRHVALCRGLTGAASCPWPVCYWMKRHEPHEATGAALPSSFIYSSRTRLQSRTEPRARPRAGAWLCVRPRLLQSRVRPRAWLCSLVRGLVRRIPSSRPATGTESHARGRAGLLLDEATRGHGHEPHERGHVRRRARSTRARRRRRARPRAIRATHEATEPHRATGAALCGASLHPDRTRHREPQKPREYWTRRKFGPDSRAAFQSHARGHREPQSHVRRRARPRGAQRAARARARPRPATGTRPRAQSRARASSRPATARTSI
jgi:hypothetical protein